LGTIYLFPAGSPDVQIEGLNERKGFASGADIGDALLDKNPLD
jgi:hypothetical protein